jgi:hypothetical protein
MSPIGFSPSSLKEGRWYEYLVRFALGGAATVFTAAVMEHPSAVCFWPFRPSSARARP